MTAAPSLDAARAWQAAGADVVMLPSGVEVQLRLPTVAGLAMRGALPAMLTNLALRYAGDGVDVPQLSAEERAKWDALERELVCDAIHGVRPPGFDEFERWRPRPDDLAAQPPAIPSVDLESLIGLVLRLQTPVQVDSLSRVAHGLIDADEATRRMSGEEAATLDGWSRFRDQRRGADGGRVGQDEPRPPKRAARNRGARRGARS